MKLIRTIRHWPAQFLAGYLEKKGEEFFKSKKELWDEIQHFLSKTGVSGCSFADYQVLYTYVRNKKPKNILECGSGASTLIMAHALFENGGNGHLVSLEEDQAYYQKVQKALPLRYTNYITLKHSKAIEKYFDFFRGSGYEEIPDRPYDFVFVDGPYFLSDPQKGTLAFNFDLLEIVQKSTKPVTAIIDTRHSTCFVYQLVFGKKFRYDYIRKLGIVTEVTKDNIAGAKKIVMKAMQRHLFKRPPLSKLLKGEY